MSLAVWNGKAGDGPGGAASVVANWRSLGHKPVIVNLPKLDGRAPSRPKPRADRAASSKSEYFASRIVTILFADAVGFSKMTESEVPRFVEHFLARLRD